MCEEVSMHQQASAIQTLALLASQISICNLRTRRLKQVDEEECLKGKCKYLEMQVSQERIKLESSVRMNS